MFLNIYIFAQVTSMQKLRFNTKEIKAMSHLN